MADDISRFACPSLGLDLGALVRRAQKGLWITVGLAIALHLVLTRVGVWREEQKAAKPLTTKFVKRQPRLTKPLEMKKRPRPKRRHMRREMVSVATRVHRGKASTGLGAFQAVG